MVEMPKGRVKMSDVAKIAGVSVITVSRALRGSPLVTTETRARILATAREQGYALNTSARALRAGTSRSIAVVLDVGSATGQLAGSLQMELLGAMLDKFNEAGYSIILACPRLLHSRVLANARGVIVLGQGRCNATLEECRRFQLPMVVWGQTSNEGDITVGPDNTGAGIHVAKYFIGLGRKNPVFVGDLSYTEVKARWHGFSNAFRPIVEPRLISTDGLGFDAGFNAVQSISVCDCILAANDSLAMGIIRALIQGGKRIPEEVSVIGFDDLRHASTFVPPLSAIQQAPSRAGGLIAKKMLALLDGYEVKSEVIHGELIIRAT